MYEDDYEEYEEEVLESDEDNPSGDEDPTDDIPADSIRLPLIKADLNDAVFVSDEAKTLLKQITDYFYMKGIDASPILVEEDTSVLFELEVDAFRIDLFLENYLGDDALVQELTDTFVVTGDEEIGVVEFSIVEVEYTDYPEYDAEDLNYNVIGDGETVAFLIEDETITSGNIILGDVIVDDVLLDQEEYSISYSVDPVSGLSISLTLSDAPEEGVIVEVLVTRYDSEES